MTNPPETPSPTQELEVIWQAMLTPSFLGVMACLRSQSLEEVYEASLDPLAVGWCQLLGWLPYVLVTSSGTR